MMPKTVIYFHRSYRKISGSGWLFLLTLMAVGLLFSVAMFLSYPYLTKWISWVAATVLSPYHPPGSIYVIEKEFVWKDVSFLAIHGATPSGVTIFANTIISVVMIVLMTLIKRYKNIAVFIIFLAVLHLVSSLFFMFYGDVFPYTGTEFSELCIKSQIGIWLFIPFILSMAFLALPAPIFSRLAVLVVTILYSLVFGTTRYIVFLFLVSKFSSIYMAILYFAFGPLVDFVYIVGIYSVYNCRLAKTLKNKQSVWKWAY
jgi:hypothetical protein